MRAAWRAGHHRGRRPAVWTPGDTLAIDWGTEGGLHVFCAVLAWSRFRFVRFADEKAATTLGLLAECFEVLGPTYEQLYAEARRRHVKGRSSMNKAELARALDR